MLRRADGDGGEVFHYRSLTAWDSSGRVLKASMTAEGRLIELVVDLAGATYPITIDPTLSLEVSLQPVGEQQPSGDLSCGVSIDLEGDRLIVGCTDYTISHEQEGAVFTFTRTPNGDWESVSRLLAPHPAEYGYFGSAVAFFADGVLIGEPGPATFSNPYPGAIHYFEDLGSGLNLAASLAGAAASSEQGWGASIQASGATAFVASKLGLPGASAVTWNSGSLVRQNLDAADPLGYLGSAFDIEGDLAMVGSPLARNSPGGPFTGAVYVFRRTADIWTRTQKIVPSVASNGNGFGSSVWLSGDTALVGAPFDVAGTDLDAGAAFLIELSAGVWSETQKLVPVSRTADARFGCEAARAGAVIVVASCSDDFTTYTPQVHSFTQALGLWGETGRFQVPSTVASISYQIRFSVSESRLLIATKTTFSGSSASHVFERAGEEWLLQGKIVLPDSTLQDSFGAAVALAGDFAVVGAPNDSYLHPHSGAVYFFRRIAGSWTLLQKLTDPSPLTGQNLGRAIALEGTTVAVSALDYDGGTAMTDSVYIYHFDGSLWLLEQRLVGAGVLTNDRFGTSLALAGDTLLVGAPFYNQGTGRVHVFERSGTLWQEQPTLQAWDSQPLSYFGWSVAVSGNRALVGVPNQSFFGGADQGAAHLFERQAGSWGFSRSLRPSDSSTNQEYGEAVALAPGWAVVGTSTTAVYVHDISGAVPIEQRLTLAAPAEFIDSIAMDGNRVVLGSSTGLDMLERDGQQWHRTATIALPPRGLNGHTVDLSGDTVIVSGPRTNDVIAGPGSAQIFRLVETPGAFYSFSPCRLADSRVTGQGPALVHGVSRSFVALGLCSVPPTARSLALNVTVTQPTGSGHLVLYAANTPAPATSTIAFSAGQTRANNATVSIASDGTGELRVLPAVSGGGTVHVILDVVGYYE